LTAFEKFRFRDAAAIKYLKRLLDGCGNNFTDAGSFDQPMRATIETLKAIAPASEKARFGDSNSGKLNDQSYIYIINKSCVP
jgi:hypothetical protein